jgi:hypothetical protein
MALNYRQARVDSAAEAALERLACALGAAGERAFILGELAGSRAGEPAHVADA